MTAIECTTAGVKDMADGSLRITLEFDPRNAKEAFSLFGARGTSCAIVAFTQEAAKQSAQDKIIEADKPKGGELAKLAGMWCKEHKFFEFIRPVYDRWMGGDGGGYGDLDSDTIGLMGEEQICRHAIYVICKINSRAEIDEFAPELFHKIIREPYSKWLRDNG